MSIHTLLCGYPSLASFLQLRLTAAVTQTAASRATTPHPHLHPILLLFANMQRSDGEARESSSISISPGPTVADLRGTLQQCLNTAPSLAVRTLAARALVALCPAGCLPAEVVRHLEVVSEHPANLQQQSADAVHGALLAAHHMLLNAATPCSEEERSAVCAAAAPLLSQRLWMLSERHCPCAAISCEFVHVLEAYNAVQALITQSFGDIPPIVHGERVVADVSDESCVIEAAARVLIQFECRLDTKQMPMQDLWSQSMARLSFSGANRDLSVALATAVRALHSQDYCLRIEGFRWLTSEGVRHLDRDSRRNIADELWAAIEGESNQVALAASLEAAVCFGGGLDIQGPQGKQQSEALYDSSGRDSSRDHALRLWLAACTAGEKRLQQVNGAAAKHGKDHSISQQLLKFTGVLLGEMIEGCNLYGVDVSAALALESACSRCESLLVPSGCLDMYRQYFLHICQCAS